MGDIINLEIITPAETMVKTEIIDLYIPAYYGMAGILSNHLPYISLLKFGEISFDDTKKKKHFFYIENGFVEVKANNISIISDIVISGKDLNKKDINIKISEIDSEIKSASEGELTSEELKIALEQKQKLVSQKRIAEKVN